MAMIRGLRRFTECGTDRLNVGHDGADQRFFIEHGDVQGAKGTTEIGSFGWMNQRRGVALAGVISRGLVGREEYWQGIDPGCLAHTNRSDYRGKTGFFRFDDASGGHVSHRVSGRG